MVKIQCTSIGPQSYSHYIASLDREPEQDVSKFSIDVTQNINEDTHIPTTQEILQPQNSFQLEHRKNCDRREVSSHKPLKEGNSGKKDLHHTSDGLNGEGW